VKAPHSPPGLIIRPATPADLHVLGRLGALMVRMHHAFDSKRFIGVGPETEARYGHYLATQLEAPNVVVLVAEEKGDVIGYAYAGLEGHDYMALRGPAGALYDIVVDPKHRRRGAGRMLLDGVLAFLKERGAPRVVLSTAERNKPAQHLFASAGFRRTMIEMTRELDDAPP
jgi:ribosomal protein S18 acetylase RimI-like enzyme